jgi:hypothetical protein
MLADFVAQMIQKDLGEGEIVSAESLPHAVTEDCPISPIVSPGWTLDQAEALDRSRPWGGEWLAARALRHPASGDPGWIYSGGRRRASLKTPSPRTLHVCPVQGVWPFATCVSRSAPCGARQLERPAERLPSRLSHPRHA